MNKNENHKSSGVREMSRRVVYTVLVGDYEHILEQDCPNSSGIDFICFTDNKDLTSSSWKIVKIDTLKLDPPRESRRYKILPHLYLSDYEESIYIDNKVKLLQDPEFIFDTYLPNSSYDFVCFKHPRRDCLYAEAERVIILDYDDERRVREQIAAYKRAGYPEGNGLISGCFLLRRHGATKVRQCMEEWFENVLGYSKRDQISFNFVAWRQNLQFTTLPLGLTDNPILRWPANSSSPQVPRDFDPDTYLWLNPDVRSAGIDPRWHYLQRGITENRRYKIKESNLLDKLSNRFGSDKGSLCYNAHYYTRVYDFYLHRLVDRDITILEIGLLRHDVQAAIFDKKFCDAPSLRMWSTYFPKGHIFGFDIQDFSGFSADRCTVVQGDQTNRDDLARLITSIGRPIDVIIDDGSHASHHQQVALGSLFRCLAPGGLYFIEDLNYQPPKIELPRARKTKNVLKNFLAHGSVQSDFMTDEEQSYLAANLGEVRFCDSLDCSRGRLNDDAIAVLLKRPRMWEAATIVCKDVSSKSPGQLVKIFRVLWKRFRRAIRRFTLLC